MNHIIIIDMYICYIYRVYTAGYFLFISSIIAVCAVP